jgi:hypothetical protein
VNTEGATTEERQLAEMLRRVTPEPPRRVTVEDVASRLADQAGDGRAGHREPRGRRGLSGWAPVLAAASVFVVAGASAGIVVGLNSHHNSSPPAGQVNSSSAPASSPATSADPRRTPASAGPTWPPVSVAGGTWGAKLINRSTIDQDSLVGGANSLYATSQGSLERIAPSTGNVVADTPYTAPIPGPPVVMGNTVWVVSSYAGSEVVLHGYDGKTLARVASVTVPVSGQVSASAGGVLTSGPDGDLYVAAGSSVAVVSSSTHQVVKRISVSAGPVNSVAVAPDGGRLYVSTGSFELLTYNLATDAQTGTGTSGIGNNAGNLVATSGGVWGTVGVGMSEWVWFAPDADLTRIVRVTEGAGAGLTSVPVLSGGTVWIGGAHTLACASPATGKALASAVIPTDGGVVEYFGSVTITGGHAYAYYLNQHAQQAGVATLTPPRACSG